MKVINLTPHAVNIGTREIPPSGEVARVNVHLDHAGFFDGIELLKGSYGDVVGLPGRQQDTLLIVSALVRAAIPERGDLASPAKLVRDSAGRIIGCEALEVNF